MIAYVTKKLEVRITQEELAKALGVPQGYRLDHIDEITTTSAAGACVPGYKITAHKYSEEEL